jgi:hypothetical protein
MSKDLKQEIKKLEEEISLIQCGDPLYLVKKEELKKLKEQTQEMNK